MVHVFSSFLLLHRYIWTTKKISAVQHHEDDQNRRVADLPCPCILMCETNVGPGLFIITHLMYRTYSK